MLPERAVAYARLYRVKDWVHFLPLPLAGWAADVHRADGLALAGGIVAWGFGLGYTAVVNQAFDDRVDRAAAKNPVGHEFGRRRALVLSVPPLFGMSATLFVTHRAGLVAALALVVAATLYSAPPRLKSVPVLGTFWNLAVALPGFYFAARPDVTALPVRPLVGLFAALLLASQLIHEAQDRDDDAAGHVRTIATTVGRSTALLVAALVVSTLPGVAWWLGAGLARRGVVTSLSAVFALAWTVLLVARHRSGDGVAMRRLRLGFRWSGALFGAAVFAVVVLWAQLS